MATGTTNNPHDLFVSAKGFELAGRLMFEHSVSERRVTNVSYAMPMVVNGAFSVEVFFKCLFILENRPLIRKHHWRELFDNLEASSQKRLEELYEETFSDPRYLLYKSECDKRGHPELTQKVALRALLDNEGDSFEKWRYSFEGTLNPGRTFRASNLITALKRRILEIKPEWKN